MYHVGDFASGRLASEVILEGCPSRPLVRLLLRASQPNAPPTRSRIMRRDRCARARSHSTVHEKITGPVRPIQAGRGGGQRIAEAGSQLLDRACSELTHSRTLVERRHGYCQRHGRSISDERYRCTVSRIQEARGGPHFTFCLQILVAQNLRQTLALGSATTCLFIIRQVCVSMEQHFPIICSFVASTRCIRSDDAGSRSRSGAGGGVQGRPSIGTLTSAIRRDGGCESSDLCPATCRWRDHLQ